MFSPRHSSQGTYSTTVSLHYNSPTSELEESSREAVWHKVRDYQHSLPVRSWLGKRLQDYTFVSLSGDHECSSLAGDVWIALIKLEGVYADLTYGKLDVHTNQTRNSPLLFRAKQCWEYCDKIVRYSSYSLAYRNPAMARSRVVSPEMLFKMTLVHSMTSQKYRRKWKVLVEMINDMHTDFLSDH